MSDEILVVRCGTVPYEQARETQKRLQGARQRGEIPDVLLLLEHPPVYTRGRRSSPAELPMGVEWYEMQGIEVLDTERGGMVTYHGPGQLVAYPIVSLAPYGGDVHEYVRKMERVMIAALGEYGVAATVFAGLTGVWTEGTPPPGPGADPTAVAEALAGPAVSARKIGSIGLHISRGVTTHGLAVNVNNDLQPFEWIVPCGMSQCAMTSLSRELGAEQDLDAFAAALTRHFAAVYDRTPVATNLDQLDRTSAPASP